MMNNLWESVFPMREAYVKCIEQVCKKYDLNRTEMAILLFLANNPEYDTAQDIVNVRYLAKSHVSMSVKKLEEIGYLEKYQLPDNKKTFHLRMLETAKPAIREGQMAQRRFMSTLCEGMSKRELDQLRKLFEKVQANLSTFIAEE